MMSEMRSHSHAATLLTAKEASLPHNIMNNESQLRTLEAQQNHANANSIKDSIFQREILNRVQKLEERSLEQILQLERTY